jgi:HD-GYP domain-containing protein (c-di-GMP phosphodiesterase class II)
MEKVKTESPFAHMSVEQRTRIGFMLYSDSYDKKFKYANDLISGLVDLEVRMAIFHATQERYVDLNSLADAEIVFGELITDVMNEAKDWAHEAVRKRTEAIMPFIDQATMEQIVAMLRVPNKPTVLGMRDWRNSLRADQQRIEKAKAESRDKFNSQHKPAPEGTVKELAARYGKSLSEIRKLKAEGLLHTLGA